MSWLNEELPTDWPSKGNRSYSDNTSGFSTSQSEGSVNVEPTVAIQPNVNPDQPQWKHAIQLPKKTNEPGLTRMFAPPPIPSQSLSQMNTSGGSYTSDTRLSDSSSTQSLSSSYQNEEPQRPISRRLKVLGRPDTYTNERLGNLLSSMGGGNQGDSHNNMLNKSTTDMNINESDGDLANNLQNEGRKVLQGLAPFRPNLSTAQESSLDELEQQLTNHGTTSQLHQTPFLQAENSNAAAYETTTSRKSDDESSSQTLESLPPGDSNWDTMGGPFHKPSQLGKLVSKHSSQTLVGSGRSAKDQEARYRSKSRLNLEPETEVSMLGINEPVQQPQNHANSFDSGVEPAHLSADNCIRRYSTEFSTSSEQPTTDSAHSVVPQPRYNDQKPYIKPSRVNFAPPRAFEMTPDHFSHRHTQYHTPTRQQSDQILNKACYILPSSNQDSHRIVSDGVSSSRTTSSRMPNSNMPRSQVASSPVNTQSEVDNSIANKDVSFSAGLELLAQLIRERSGHISASSVEMLDSLDLSNCDLETVVGLDRFVPGLTTLFLNDNMVRSLQGLPMSLVHLDLSFNKLSNINMFPACFVSTLILSNNDLESLEPLSNLRALSSLDVSNNKLKTLRGIEKLTALRTLNLRNNKLESLNISLGMLVELDAAHNNITAVSLNAPNLESLDLEGNKVIAMTEPLSNLRELNVRYNDATVDFKDWQSLETLLFDGNKAVRNLNSVADILVTFSWEQPKSNTRFQQFSTCDLNNIRDLKLSGRPTGWPFPTNNIFSAQHVDISMCNIRELPLNLSAAFPFLRSLNLGFNKLDSRCIPILADCKSLERLSLFGNRLDIGGEKLARLLPQLRVLDSRSQNRAHKLIGIGEYATEVYGAITEADAKADGSILKTSSKNLQWVDGRWTNNASNTKQTTRPGFASPLYPESWDPPSSDTPFATNSFDDDMTVIGTLTSWDIVEACYVHHYMQSLYA